MARNKFIAEFDDFVWSDQVEEIEDEDEAELAERISNEIEGDV